MQITRNSVETAAGPDEWFTGTVHIEAALTGLAEARTLELEDGVEVL